jgi:hypothetical protein
LFIYDSLVCTKLGKTTLDVQVSQQADYIETSTRAAFDSSLRMEWYGLQAHQNETQTRCETNNETPVNEDRFLTDVASNENDIRKRVQVDKRLRHEMTRNRYNTHDTVKRQSNSSFVFASQCLSKYASAGVRSMLPEKCSSSSPTRPTQQRQIFPRQPMVPSRSPESIIEERPWKRVKDQNCRLQKRAFNTLRENPFANYNHDPNEAEKVLSDLASTSRQSNIIPHGTLHRLTDTCTKKGNSRKPAKRLMQTRRRSTKESHSEQYILAEKAREHAYSALSTPQGNVSRIRKISNTSRNHVPQDRNRYSEYSALDHIVPARQWSPELTENRAGVYRRDGDGGSVLYLQDDSFTGNHEAPIQCDALVQRFVRPDALYPQQLQTSQLCYPRSEGLYLQECQSLGLSYMREEARYPQQSQSLGPHFTRPDTQYSQQLQAQLPWLRIPNGTRQSHLPFISPHQTYVDRSNLERSSHPAQFYHEDQRAMHPYAPYVESSCLINDDNHSRRMRHNQHPGLEDAFF